MLLVELVFLLLSKILSFKRVYATFDFGGYGCSCAPTPVCPPVEVCASAAHCVPSLTDITPRPAPIAVQVPLQVPATDLSTSGQGSNCLCSSGVGTGCYGYGSYSSTYDCSKHKFVHHRESKQRLKFTRSQRRFRRALVSNSKNEDNWEHKNLKKDPKCNNENLRRIMKKAVGIKTSALKRNIQMLVENKLGGQYSVLCGQGEFSYTTTTDEYCQTQVMNHICYVFRRKQIPDNQEVEDYEEPNES